MKIFYSKTAKKFMATQYDRETRSTQTLATADTLDQLLAQVDISDEPEMMPSSDEGGVEDLASLFEGIEG